MAAWQLHPLFSKTSLCSDLVTSQETHPALSSGHMLTTSLRNLPFTHNYRQGLSARGNTIWKYNILTWKNTCSHWVWLTRITLWVPNRWKPGVHALFVQSLWPCRHPKLTAIIRKHDIRFNNINDILFFNKTPLFFTLTQLQTISTLV